MEFLKKTIKFTPTGSTGTTGTTGITAQFKILLCQEVKDMGFFDVYPDDTLTGMTGTTVPPYLVTGVTRSRLSTLRKYSNSPNFFDNYFLSTTPTTNGLDNNLSVTGVTGHTLIYYIDGITYTEYSGETVEAFFSFEGVGWDSDNFINKPIYKDPNKTNIVSNPKVRNDVFIVRQETSAFEKNYKLEHIRNLAQLETYAGGNYFNIVKNS